MEAVNGQQVIMVLVIVGAVAMVVVGFSHLHQNTAHMGAVQVREVSGAEAILWVRITVVAPDRPVAQIADVNKVDNVKIYKPVY